MDIGQIEKVMKLMQAYGFNEIEWEKGDEKIKLVHNPPTIATTQNLPIMPNLAHPSYPHNVQAPYHPTPDMAAPKHSEPSVPSQNQRLNLREVRSPFVGTYYASPSPGSDPFVTVGKRVRKGDTLCIIEAMKLMNEIEAEKDGVIVEILVGNEEPVEYDQLLFLME